MSSIRPARVRRADVAACMTCPLCHKLLLQATTISLCLHTFCRDCIYKKFTDDECDTCPVCDINLGCDPADKLRPDHNLQDIRAKVFPIKRRMAAPPEAVPPVSPPAKRKERSLSSLVVTTSRTPPHAGVTGRRTRVGPRKSSAPKKADLVEDSMDGQSSPETSTKVVQNKKPVNGQREETRGVRNDGATVTGPVKRKRQCSPGGSTNMKKPPQLVVDVLRPHRNDLPIWFSLVASENQVTDGVASQSLPQIASGFLRVKNGDMPVAYIQKYVAKKLGLASEDEVLLMFQGKVLQPGLELRELLGAWLGAAPGSRCVSTSVGGSAKEFVMVLTYSRKVQAEAQAGAQ